MHEQAIAARRTRVDKHPGVYFRLDARGRRVYEFDYYDSTGKRRWQTVDGNLAEAVARREELRSRRRRGELVSPADGKRPLADVWRPWLDAQTHLRPRTRHVYETNLRVHVLPRLGRRSVASITADDVASLVAELRAEGLSPWTIRGVLTPLGRVLGHAVRRGWIGENPMRRLERGERPAVERREMRVLGTEEIRRLLAHARPKYRPLVATAVFTGLRQGELLGLTWGDVDFAGGLVRVRKQLDRSGARVDPKTPQAAREVVLMPSLGRMLREHREAAFAAGRAGAGDYVFATEAGTPMYWRNVSKRGLGKAAEDAKLVGGDLPNLRFHDLRHTFASLLIAQGHDVVFVSRQLGHASAKITLDVYGHLFDRKAHAEKARTGLEAAFANVLDAAPENVVAMTGRRG